MILNRCSHYLYNNKNLEITADIREELEDMNEELAKRGERVLAFAHLELPRNKYPPGYEFTIDTDPPNFPLEDLTFVGFMSLIDPPRL